MSQVPASRHLVRAKDFADAHHAEPIGVVDLAAAARLSPAHFSRQFRAAFGETPHAYLLSRRLERAASLLRTTDWTVLRICTTVGLTSQGSFTTSFRRMFGLSPSDYRAAHPPAAHLVRVPPCVVRANARPVVRTAREGPVRMPGPASIPPAGSAGFEKTADSAGE